MSSQVDPQQHKQPTNTTTMAKETLALQQHGFYESTPPEGWAALRMFVPRPQLKQFIR
jgi:hypothetical protein